MYRPSLLPIAISAVLLGACTDDVRHPPHAAGGYDSMYDSPCAQLDARPARSTIDRGARMTAPVAGDEAGLFVEYWEDPAEPLLAGVWEVTTTCDTARSDYSCLWDVYALPEHGDADYAGYEIEYEDTLGWYGAELGMFTETAYGVDGFTLYAEPGVPVRFEVYLDGCSANRYVYWVGEGAAHAGAPTNPIELVPAY